MGQDPGAAIAGNDPDFHKARGQSCGGGGDAHVAENGDVHPKPNGGTIDGGDGGDFHIRQRANNVLDAAAIIGAGGVGLRLRTDAGAFADRLEIAA